MVHTAGTNLTKEYRAKAILTSQSFAQKLVLGIPQRSCLTGSTNSPWSLWSLRPALRVRSEVARFLSFRSWLLASVCKTIKLQRNTFFIRSLSQEYLALQWTLTYLATTGPDHGQISKIAR